MTARATNNALWIVLAVLAAALAHALGPDDDVRSGSGRTDQSLDTRAGEPSSALLPDTSVVALAPAPDEAQFAAIAQRPLFSPRRRPPEHRPVAEPTVPEAPTPAPAPPPRLAKDRYRLLGVVVDEEDPVALLMVRDHRGILHLRIGDDLDGWEVVGIERGALRLQNRQANERIALRETGLGSAVTDIDLATRNSRE